MKNVVFFLFIIFIFNACQSPKVVKDKPAVNHVVILDLSDRILYPNQADKDKAVFKEIIESFVAYVNNNIALTSRDRLQLRIIPQKGSKIDIDHFEQVLSIDMNSLLIQEKRESLETFTSSALHHLDQLYKLAYQGNKSYHYAGVDIWRYFNEQLSGDLLNDYKNRVYILTDGYFDFENNKHSINDQHLYTHSHFLSLPIFSGVDWKRNAEEGKYGYLPLTIEKDFQLCVIGIQPKSEVLLEIEKLEYFWTKWMIDSGAEPPVFIRNASPTKMKGALQNISVTSS